MSAQESAGVTVTADYVDSLVEVTEEIGARSPGWYRATCAKCDSTTTGSEPTVEDWAYEHVQSTHPPSSGRKLRVLHTVVQPVLVWDDGTDLTPGPAIDPVTLTLTALAEFVANLPEQIANLAEKLAEQE